MQTGKEVADKWFDQFGSGMQQSRVELAAMIDDALRAVRAGERSRCAGVVDNLARVVECKYRDPNPQYNTASAVHALYEQLAAIAADTIRNPPTPQ